MFFVPSFLFFCILLEKLYLKIFCYLFCFPFYHHYWLVAETVFFGGSYWLRILKDSFNLQCSTLQLHCESQEHFSRKIYMPLLKHCAISADSLLLSCYNKFVVFLLLLNYLFVIKTWEKWFYFLCGNKMTSIWIPLFRVIVIFILICRSTSSIYCFTYKLFFNIFWNVGLLVTNFLNFDFLEKIMFNFRKMLWFEIEF